MFGLPLFKVASEDMNATIDYIETEWNKLEPSHPFRYKFLDEKFGALLKQQENFGTMFLFLTILAIIISAMGLYGLSSFTAEQRTKEIGIRKVLGSSVGGIMNMLTKDFLKTSTDCKYCLLANYIFVSQKLVE